MRTEPGGAVTAVTDTTRAIRITIGIGLVLAFVSSTQAGDGRPTPARLELDEGDILVQSDGSDAWYPAPANLPLDAGDRVWVPGRGRAEIQLPTGPAIRLGEATRLAIRSLACVGGGIAEIVLEQGTARIAGEPALPGCSLQIDLPSAIVRLGGATAVRVDLDDEGIA